MKSLFWPAQIFLVHPPEETSKKIEIQAFWYCAVMQCQENQTIFVFGLHSWRVGIVELNFKIIMK